MKKKQIAHLLVATLLAVPVSLLKTQSSVAGTGTTSFACDELRGHPSGATYATYAFRNGRRLPPMITWSRTVGANGEWTPEKRCKDVTPKFNAAIDYGQRNLSDLWLTTGMVNDQWVICYVNNVGGGCNSNNQLMTLTGDNTKDPGEALGNLLGYRSNPHLWGSGIDETGPTRYYNLGEVVDSLDTGGTVDDSPVSDYDVGPI